MPSRVEHDSIGAIEVPTNALWGAQTQRCLLNFAIGQEKIPLNLIFALAKIKLSSSIVNNRLGLISDKKKTLIIQACTEILKGKHNSQFPLKVWQTGSGTQTNMNINEVISNIGARATGNPLGSHIPLHPNDDVNCSQSTNDVFPSAIHIATIEEIKASLIPELESLIKVLIQKSIAWSDIIKIGRTHLQDAVPLSLGQEVSAWQNQLDTAKNRIETSLSELYSLPLGGTAIGTGLNAPKYFDKEVVSEVSLLTNLPFKPAKNKFSIMASHDGLVNTMSQLKLLAVSLLKIVNDIRLLSCGPRAGLAELKLPENEPGSSIMPGKINPTQCEAMSMVCMQVMGLDSAVTMGGSGGQLQMNVYKPLLGFNLLTSIRLLNDACQSCRKFMLEGLQANESRIDNDLNQSLMLVTALSPKIGYEKACKIAQFAHKENVSLREAAIELKYVSADEFDELVNPKLMANPHSD
ncbi:Fumarate hydratase class II [Prochlorococcus sp. MIT 0601]|nr:Fumarate hydratase class II [Prochlorococcus sp. MIT 0601]